MANNKPLSGQERYATIARVNWICSIVDALLSIFKLVVGLTARSPSLIADGLHSLSDLATDILALVLGKLAQHGPDQDHPYGHARYETIGTVLLGATLVAVAVGIGYENLVSVWQRHSVVPHWVTLVAVAISVLSKETLFHYTIRQARRTRSNLLEANAWHSRSDSLSSIVVFFGVIGAMAGYPIFEYLAALVVAFLIGKMGVQLTWEATQDLIDRGVSQEKSEAYRTTLNELQAIDGVHMIRTRLMGTDVFIDAHIQVDPSYTVSEAHQLNDYAAQNLKDTHEEIADVTLHIDFEADDIKNKTSLPPKRHQLEQALLSTELADFKHCYLHYCGNKLTVELLYPKCESLPKNSDVIITKLREEFNWLADVRIYQEY